MNSGDSKRMTKRLRESGLYRAIGLMSGTSMDGIDMAPFHRAYACVGHRCVWLEAKTGCEARLFVSGVSRERSLDAPVRNEPQESD
jgi:hypothetical protein